jgi:hypothetical protein
VLQDADTSDNLFHQSHSVFESAPQNVSWIADESLASCDSLRTLNPGHLAIFEEDLIHIGVQHESSTIHCADSRKTLWDTSQPKYGIYERAGVFSHGVHVELDLSNELDCRPSYKGIVGVEGNSVTDKVNGVFFQSVFLEHISSGFINFDSVIGFYVAFLKVLNDL